MLASVAVSTISTISAATHQASANVAATTVAVFDLDRTLIPGSSLSLFGRLALEEGLIRRTDLGRNLVAEAWFTRRGLGAPALDRVAQRLLLLVAGREYLPLVDLAERCATMVLRRVFAGARSVIDQHQQLGHRTLLLSASPQEVVSLVARDLGMDCSRGTVLEVVDGRLTGSLAGPVCSGEAKVRALADMCNSSRARWATAYADSATDLPLLEAVDFPVAVNPDAKMRAAAELRGWPVVRFS